MKRVLLVLAVAIGFASCSDDDNDNNKKRLNKMTEYEYYDDGSLGETTVTTFRYSEGGLIIEMNKEYLTKSGEKTDEIGYLFIYDERENITGLLYTDGNGNSTLTPIETDSKGYVSSIGESSPFLDFSYVDNKISVYNGKYQGVELYSTFFTWKKANAVTINYGGKETHYEYDNKKNYFATTGIPDAVLLVLDINYGHSFISVNNPTVYSDKNDTDEGYRREYTYDGNYPTNFTTFYVNTSNGGYSETKNCSTFLEYEEI